MEAGERDRLRRTARLTLLVMAVLFGLVLSGRHLFDEYDLRAAWRPDYTVFWTGSHMAERRPDLLYNEPAMRAAQLPLTHGDRGPRPWISAPSFLLWLWPFTRLPFIPSLIAWDLVGLAVYLAGVWLVSRSALVAGLSAVMPNAVVSLLTGQASLLTGGFMLAAVRWLEARPLIAGALFGLAATIKPQAVVLAPVAMIAARNWRALGAALAAGGLVGAVSLAFAPRLWLDWLQALRGFLPLVEAMQLQRHAITPAGLAAQIGLTGPLAGGFAMVCAVAGVVLVWRVFSRPNDIIMRTGALAVGTLLATPYGMNYEGVVMTPVCLMILMRAERNWLLWGAAAASLYLLGAFGPVLLGIGLLIQAFRGPLALVPQRSPAAEPAPA
jgi:hypothetical protein